MEFPFISWNLEQSRVEYSKKKAYRERLDTNCYWRWLDYGDGNWFYCDAWHQSNIVGTSCLTICMQNVLSRKEKQYSLCRSDAVLLRLLIINKQHCYLWYNSKRETEDKLAIVRAWTHAKSNQICRCNHDTIGDEECKRVRSNDTNLFMSIVYVVVIYSVALFLYLFFYIFPFPHLIFDSEISLNFLSLRCKKTHVCFFSNK